MEGHFPFSIFLQYRAAQTSAASCQTQFFFSLLKAVDSIPQSIPWKSSKIIENEKWFWKAKEQENEREDEREGEGEGEGETKYVKDSPLCMFCTHFSPEAVGWIIPQTEHMSSRKGDISLLFFFWLEMQKCLKLLFGALMFWTLMSGS